MSTLFSKPDAPDPLPVPGPDASEVAEAQRLERRRGAAAKGRQSTLLTSGQAADTTNYSKTLLGA